MVERWKPSVTVAALASRARHGRIEYLLVEETTSEGLCLNNPAGHLEPGESLEQAVAREALEETTCRFVADRLVGVYLAPAESAEGVTYLRFAYGGSVGEPDPALQLDSGIVRTLWLSLDDVRASRERHRSPLVLRCIEDDAAGRAYPRSVVSHEIPTAPLAESATTPPPSAP